MKSSLIVLLALVVSAPSAALAQGLTIAVEPSVEEPHALAIVAQGPPPPSVAQDESDEDVSGYSAIGFWVEGTNLSRVSLSFRSPEVEALQGLVLTPDWAGNAALADPVLGGSGLAFGMRAQRFIRGPELRIWAGGGSLEGPWAAAPGVDGIELSIRSAFVLRLEAALGVQVPIGPVVPYVLGRAAVGGAWFDVAVREARLGGLGTETVDATIFELGLEAGIAYRFGDGAEVGFAFRASFLGTESFGGVLTVGFDGSPDAQ